ncbi:MAG: type II toxin-antitoxin system RelE/ParE family toxin [Thermodesulfobacteriota bacterium]
MNFGIEVSHRADKMLGRLDRKTATRIRDRIDQLAIDPFNPRISYELEMIKGQRYSRVGDWRVIYEVREADQTVLIVTVQHRSRVYKELPK